MLISQVEIEPATVTFTVRSITTLDKIKRHLFYLTSYTYSKQLLYENILLQILHDDILSKQPPFKQLTETASQLMGLVGDDEATTLADRLQAATDR